MKLAMKYIILYVRNVEETMHFYRDVLQLPVKMQVDTYVEFDTGMTTLSFNTRESVRQDIGLDVADDLMASSTFEIGFVVEDVVATIEHLRQQQVVIAKEPVVKPWGQTVAYITDPDGHFIEICSAIE
ncbi:VOC family protein [Paenibacillus sp. PK4536]|uniref:VOC family protein n=1 Tax=Paenibacillus sp. PK4536 TaxID=3024576 RepID=UPI0023580ECB|nr:VOC family protein [Paenibacillus sp. PK4536]WIM38652.1 VOC family protein [Paenibacillus sp. PK4536]